MASETFPPTVMIERSFAALQSGLDLYARRTEAACDYLRALPHVREPQELGALQSAYWTRAAEDYGAAMLQAFAPASEPKAAPAVGGEARAA